MLPSVDIQKTDGNTGVVRPSSTGVLAIIAPSEKGTANQPTAITRAQTAVDVFGYGPLSEWASYVLPVAAKPVLLVNPTAATAGAYGTVTQSSGGGTTVITAGGTSPLDAFNVKIEFLAGGTVGVTGITYRESLDGGVSFSAAKALGTATSILIPNTGVTLAIGAGTVVAGETAAVVTTAPAFNGTDLVASLEALRVTSSPWEALLLDIDATATLIGQVDAFLASLEPSGKYRFAVMNARARNVGESETSYKDALATLFAAAASTRVIVCADGADVVSSVRGIAAYRPTSLGLAARLMKIDMGTDAAYVGDGPLPGFTILDERANPKYHDELLYPGIDDLRLASLRSFHGREGAFVTNTRVISPTGSDYQYAQHVRCMNRACELAYEVLTQQLSRGVDKNPKPGPGGARYILEEDAQLLEGLVQVQLNRELVTPRRVSAARFSLSRTDDIGSNGPATLTGDLEIEARAYVKKFAVTAKYTKQIAATAA